MPYNGRRYEQAAKTTRSNNAAPIAAYFYRMLGAVNLNYMNEKSIVVWKDGSYKLVNSNESWEYENDEDWLTTITISSLTS